MSEEPPKSESPAPRRHLGSSNWRTREALAETSSPPPRGLSSPRDGWRSGSSRPRDGDSSKPRNSTLVDDSAALQEGRRIYVGNLLYYVTPNEVTKMLEENGFTDYEHIHISIDPVSGRNPGYCFVEFETLESANAAIEKLAGVEIRGRTLKTGPCEPKTRQRGGMSGEARSKPTFERWGDWKGKDMGAPVSGQGPYGAVDHLDEVLDKDQQTRLYVGGLTKMINQAQNDEEIAELFSGFKYTAISKRITPHESTRSKPGNHHYCFVDFETHEDAVAAMNAVREESGLRINVAKALPKELVKRTNELRSGDSPASTAKSWRRD